VVVTLSPRDSLVLCTRNRPADVATCLASVAACTPPPAEVVVVDSSDAFETRDLCAALLDDFPVPLRYHADTPGLPHQRNTGVGLAMGEVVHFVDDDTVLEPTYFAAIDACFDDGGVVGACGQITNLGPRRVPPFLYRFFLLDGGEGRVLRSGKNILNFTATTRRPTAWLSGCSMSYRRSLFDTIGFDEDMTGYALGEDVDFSTRAGRHGSLLHEPAARLRHDESPLERWSRRRMIHTELQRRRARVRASYAGETSWAFWWSVLGQLLVLFLGGVRKASRYRLLSALWTLSGAWGLLRTRSEDSTS